MARFSLFLTAVAVLYIGGFAYEHIGPLFYSLIITLIASIPLLLKGTFWKKIILMLPLLVLRVVGKIFLILFGKNALSKVLAKYGLLEKRFNRIIETFEQSKNQALNRWKNLPRASQAYLLLIFFPVALAIFVIALLVKIVRLRFLQFMIEKLMQSILMKWTSKVQSKLTNPKSPGSQLAGSSRVESQDKEFGSKLTSTAQNEPKTKNANTGRIGPETVLATDKDNDSSGDSLGRLDKQD